MSTSYVSAEIRRLVAARAEGVCEYCLIAEEDTFFGCAVDHIISEKHGGPTSEANLAVACAFCNWAKGSDIGSLDWNTGEFARFFNPRTDRWYDHFILSDNRIDALTVIGKLTIQILRFNTSERLMERQILQQLKRYPSESAVKRIKGIC